MRVDPRVGDEDDGALAGDALEGDPLEEELGVLQVPDEDGARDALRLVPLEVHPEHRLPVRPGLERQHRLLQVRRLPSLPPASIACDRPTRPRQAKFSSHKLPQQQNSNKMLPAEFQ